MMLSQYLRQKPREKMCNLAKILKDGCVNNPLANCFINKMVIVILVKFQPLTFLELTF